MSTIFSSAPSTSADAPRARAAGTGRALVAYAAATVLVTWPLAAHLTSRLGAIALDGDPLLNLWILGWDLRTLSAHPGWLLTGRIFDANIFYPAAGTLAYSDHQILQAIAVWPVYAIAHNLALCYNLVLLASLFFSAWAMDAFVRDTTGSGAAAFVAGLVWGFCPYHITHLIHLQLQALYFLPLAFLLLHRTVATGRRRDAVGLGVVAGLQTIASIYYGLIGGVGLIIGGAVLLAATGAWRTRRRLALLVLAAIVAVVVSLPGVVPYWRASAREGFARDLFEASHGSAVPASYVQAPPVNVIYGRTGWLRPSPGGGGPLRRKEGPEQDLFPGFVVLLLAVMGSGYLFQGGPGGPVSRAALAVGVAGFILSLGPDGVRPLYSVLFRSIFGFQAIRAPARFSVLVFFALAVLAGLGVEKGVGIFFSDRKRWKNIPTPFVVFAAGLIGLEYFNGAIPFAPAPPATTAVGRWIAAAPEPGPVLYLPLSLAADSTRVMVASLEHGRPIVNGYSGQRPAAYPALVDTMASFPSADALLALHDLGVRFVIAPSPVAATNTPTPLVERARLDGQVIYELRWTPDIEAALAGAIDSPAPPPAGPLPFAHRETARYHAIWLNGPLAVSAGDVVVTAVRTEAGVTLDVRATTAPWVQRFYEASDAFETRADAQLLPITHRQELQEGRRRIVRTIAFDRTARRVHVQTGDSAPVQLPLALWARDPLAALFYARTLPLAAGYQTRIPITDTGRAVTLDLRVVGPETVTIGGRSLDALRVEPRLIARVERRAPLDTTVWLSRDERRLPLLVRVSAGFGSVQLELVDAQDE